MDFEMIRFTEDPENGFLIGNDHPTSVRPMEVTYGECQGGDGPYLPTDFNASSYKPTWVQPVTFDQPTGLERCHVCDGTAGKHNSYGGKVCASCRAFFRRSVQTKYYEIFSCSGGNETCIINVGSRKKCKYCRFKRCLQARMKISWVLSEQERDRRFNKLRKVSQRNGLKEIVDEVTPLLPILYTPELRLTSEELLKIDRLKNFIGAKRSSKYDNFFASEQECLKHLAQVAYFGLKIDVRQWKKFTDAGCQFSREILMNLEDMQALPVEDREALIRANSLSIFSYTEAVCINEEDSTLCNTIRDAIFSRKYPVIYELIDLLERNGMKEKIPVLFYDQVYVSPWTATAADELRHRELIEQMKLWAKLPQLSPDSHDRGMESLMRFIIAFYPERISLLRREMCQKVRQHYSMMLYRYLKNTYENEASRKFNEAMVICDAAREAAMIISRRLPV